jgi:hypothetical protein
VHLFFHHTLCTFSFKHGKYLSRIVVAVIVVVAVAVAVAVLVVVVVVVAAIAAVVVVVVAAAVAAAAAAAVFSCFHWFSIRFQRFSHTFPILFCYLHDLS